MRVFPCVAAVSAACVFAFAAAAQAGEAERGERLYSQRCHECHAESVHSREKRSARDFGEIREWVRHWDGVLKLGWGAEEIEDVTTYLNARYYRFQAPAATTLREEPGLVAAVPPLHQVLPPAR